MSANERRGSAIICEALIREGTDLIFGIPGGAIMPFYHSLFEYRDQLRHVLCRHEQGAGHAAEGYARATGRVGVCVGTSGPGATNLVTPIADAWMDGTPLVVITGQVNSALLGTDAFQETDITGITIPITKHNYLITRPEDIPAAIHEAFHIAKTGRPGPVLVDITKDAQLARCVPDWTNKKHLPNKGPLVAINDDVFAEVLRSLAGAARPLILAGNGVIQAGASELLRELAERVSVPVITTLHGLGAFPQNHPLSLGMPGMHGWVHVNRAIQKCDVLLNIGSRFDDRVTGRANSFAPNARIIHIDIDSAEIGKVVRADVAIHADALAALQRLVRLSSRANHQDWLDEVRALQEIYRPTQPYSRREHGSGLAPSDVYDLLDRSFASQRAVRVVTDVGQHQMWAAQLLTWTKPRTHITSGGAGTMGFAVPAALGVALACPDEIVWVVCGDGGFQMTNQELATMQQEGIRNVRIALINNGYLGMVRQWQQLFEGKRYSETLLSGPDFVALAQAYGWNAVRAELLHEAEAAIDHAWNHDGPVLIDFRVQGEANVFPIVPAGESIGSMLLAGAGDVVGAATPEPHPGRVA